MQSEEAIHYQRVNTPLTTENLDATKIQPRPPSRSIKPEKERRSKTAVDLATVREGYFSGTASSINSRLIYLADIGRCDLYGRSAKRMQQHADTVYKLPNRELDDWFTISNADFHKKKQARATSDSDQRLINEFKTPLLSNILKGDEPLPFNIQPSFLVEMVDVNIDNIRYKRYTINLLKKSYGFIVDTWWWIYLDRFCLKSENRLEFSKKDIEAAQNELMYKISDKFIHMVFESERLSQRDFMGNCHLQYFKQLAKLLALIVYSGFCHAWMNDRPLFVNEEFHQYLLDRFSLWVEGLRHVPENENDGMWRRVEPLNMRKNQHQSTKDSKGKSGKGSGFNFDFRQYLESQTGGNEKSRWNRAKARFTILNQLGNNLRSDSETIRPEIPESFRRHSHRRNTVVSRKSIKPEEMLKLNHVINSEKTMVFETSKFDVNGCSPLFELAFPSNKTQRLVSRRSCVPKEQWIVNPLQNSYSHVKTANACVRKAKKILDKKVLGRP